MKVKVKASIPKNRLYFTFSGKVSRQDVDKLYTDTIFRVANMKAGFDVISDCSECFLLHPTGVSQFRKIMNYLIENNVGEIVRIVTKRTLFYEQILNLSSIICGYRPIYVYSHEEAEEKLENSIKRNGIRFHINKLYIKYTSNEEIKFGNIVNISTSGCEVSSESSQHSVDEKVTISIMFNINDESLEEFEIVSRIVRVENNAFAVKFEDLNNEKKEKLWKCLIHESQRDV